jgi:hypothetical protein
VEDIAEGEGEDEDDKANHPFDTPFANDFLDAATETNSKTFFQERQSVFADRFDGACTHPKKLSIRLLAILRRIGAPNYVYGEIMDIIYNSLITVPKQHPKELVVRPKLLTTQLSSLSSWAFIGAQLYRQLVFLLFSFIFIVGTGGDLPKTDDMGDDDKIRSSECIVMRMSTCEESESCKKLYWEQSTSWSLLLDAGDCNSAASVVVGPYISPPLNIKIQYWKILEKQMEDAERGETRGYRTFTPTELFLS